MYTDINNIKATDLMQTMLELSHIYPSSPSMLNDQYKNTTRFLLTYLLNYLITYLLTYILTYLLTYILTYLLTYLPQAVQSFLRS